MDEEDEKERSKQVMVKLIMMEFLKAKAKE